MLTKNEIHTENSGSNSGMIVGINTGTISLQSQNIVKMPSHIACIVKSLGALDMGDGDSSTRINIPFTTDAKLKFNHVVKYKEIIKENSIFFSQCEDILNLYDNSNIGSKNRILQCVRKWYLEEKGNLLLTYDNENQTEIVRTYADALIDKVSERIKHTILSSVNMMEMSQEDLELGTSCFVCYCFMKCKILENPI